MEQDGRRFRIEGKLASGELCGQPFPRVWNGPGNGDPCDGCDEATDRSGLVVGGIDLLGRTIQMHVHCFRLWEAVRVREGDERRGGRRVAPAPAQSRS